MRQSRSSVSARWAAVAGPHQASTLADSHSASPFAASLPSSMAFSLTTTSKNKQRGGNHKWHA